MGQAVFDSQFSTGRLCPAPRRSCVGASCSLFSGRCPALLVRQDADIERLPAEAIFDVLFVSLSPFRIYALEGGALGVGGYRPWCGVDREFLCPI